MSEYRTAQRMNQGKTLLQFAPLLLITVSMLPQVAGAQTDLSDLTNTELIDQIHRESFRAEYMHRIRDYSVEQREVAMKKLRYDLGRRRFPQDYSEDELFACIRDFNDIDPAFKALDELKLRYENATPKKLAILCDYLRSEYGTTPYPVFIPETPSDPDYLADRIVYYGLDEATRRLLPEDLALKLFREVYLDSGQKGAITKFLSCIKGKPFTGPATLAVLEELRIRTASYDQRRLDALGEIEGLGTIISNQLRQCVDVRFEDLNKVPWQHSGVAIMGSFANPEARVLLLDLYASIPKEDRFCKRRLSVLSALIIRWDRVRDSEFRQVLHHELTEILNMDYTKNPAEIQSVVQVIVETRDPYFIPLLKKRRSTLNVTAIRNASTMSENYLEKTLQTVFKRLDEATKKLNEVG